MRGELESMFRLKAHEILEPVQSASAMKIAIHPDAVIICPLAMAGEGATLHGIVIGSMVGTPVFRFTPDPRLQDDHRDLLRAVGTDIEACFMAAKDGRTYPQVWVSSPAARELVEGLVDRARTDRDPGVRRFADCMSHLVDRYAFAGQQGFLSASTAIKAHFVTGQSPEEEEHLGRLLSWFLHPPGVSPFDAGDVAAKMPMGVKTDPVFDQKVLEPLVATYGRIRRRKGSSLERERITAAIGEAIRPVAMRVFDAVRASVLILQETGLPPMRSLPELERREIDAFERFMDRMEKGIPDWKRDHPRGTTRVLALREEAARSYDAAVSLEDDYARAGHHLCGKHLLGTVLEARSDRVHPRRTVHHVVVCSSRDVSRVRKGDTLYDARDPRLRFVVVDVSRTETGISVEMRITGGMKSLGLPSAGSEIELVAETPEWERYGRIRQKVGGRIRCSPWTHTGLFPAPVASVHPSFMPVDPLAEVEAIR